MLSTIKGLFAPPPSDEITESQEDDTQELSDLLTDQSDRGDSTDYQDEDEEREQQQPPNTRKGLSWFLSAGDDSEDTTEDTAEDTAEDSEGFGGILSNDTDIISKVTGVNPYQVPDGDLPTSCNKIYQYLKVDESVRNLFTAGAHLSTLAAHFKPPKTTSPLKYLFPEITLEQDFLTNYNKLTETLDGVYAVCKEESVDILDDLETIRVLSTSLLKEFEQKYGSLLNVSNSIVQFKRALGNFSARKEAMEFITDIQNTPVCSHPLCAEGNETSQEFADEDSMGGHTHKIIEYLTMLCFENEKYHELVSKHQMKESGYQKEIDNLVAMNESQISLISQLKAQLERSQTKIRDLENRPQPEPQIVRIVDRQLVPMMSTQEADTGHELADLLKEEEAKNLHLSSVITSLQNKLRVCEKKLDEDLEEIMSSSVDLVSQQTGLTQVLKLDNLEKTVAEQRLKISDLEKKTSESQAALDKSHRELEQMKQTQMLSSIRTNLAHESLANLKSKIKFVV